MTTILRVLVGSRAHGLHTIDSDWDYRGVFVQPTSALLSIGAKPQTTQWTEADKAKGEKLDDTGWEIGHFLQLATHCNPSILEVFAAPVHEQTEEGECLRALLPYVWHPKGVLDAFIGYGVNQRKKFLDDKDQRSAKYACSYLRVIYQAFVLLGFKKMLVDMTDTPVFDTLKKWRTGDFTKGEVIDATAQWTASAEDRYRRVSHTPDLQKVNAFLLDVRKRHFGDRRYVI